MVDWLKIGLTVLQVSKKEEPPVDPKFMVIRPAVLSDANLLKGLSALKMVLSFVPGAALAAPVLTLGDVGFKLWKRVALEAEYADLSIPPVGINVMALKIRLDPVLREHFSHLLVEQNYPATAEVFNDFLFGTTPELLTVKYPQLPAVYIAAACSRNRQALGDALGTIQQALEAHRSIPEVDQNLRGAVAALTGLFPSMRDWALLKSENFDEIVEIIDTVV